MVPVPGDLPVFTHLALASCMLQTAEHRVQTIVVPDRPDPRISELVDHARRAWPGPLREVLIRRPERSLLPRLGNAGRNHGFQIATAVAATPASHVILHDADLFLLDPAAHDAQYRETVDRDLDVLGVSPAWDAWFAERGRSLAATWEMVARVDWLRRFAPWRLLGHEADVLGERHVLDTTFWAQLHTAPERIAVHDGTGGVVHFNYLISQYRLFVRDTGTYVDHHAALLVIRVLSDVFLPEAAIPELPELGTLALGLAQTGGRVTYAGVDAAGYHRNRGLLEEVLRGPWADDAARDRARESLLPFDRHFGWEGSGPAPVVTPSATPVADVTVVIPVKDRGHLLAGTLDSVFGQVPSPAAVLVVDDGSTDDSAEVATRRGARVLRHERPRGPGAARNSGLAAAATHWVAFCDSDDQWLPGHLAGLLRVADEHVLATAPARTTSGRWCGNSRDRAVVLDPAAFLVPGEGICCSATMVRRAAALAVGGFDETMLAEDFALWLRLLDRGTGVETDHATVLYREHDNQLSADSAGMQAAVWSTVDTFAGRPWLTPDLRLRAQSRTVWDDLRAAQRAGDRRTVRTGLTWYVRHPRAVRPLGTLLAQRVRARSVARRLPMDVTLRDTPSGSVQDARPPLAARPSSR